MTIGLLHPGDMGAVVGACARAAGQRVLWAATGRSADTRARAAAAGLEDAGTVAKVLAASDVVLSICPPHAALDLAREVAAHRFAGLYVDGNAVAPATAREVGAVVEQVGATFVDGGLIGLYELAPLTTLRQVGGKLGTEEELVFQTDGLPPSKGSRMVLDQASKAVSEVAAKAFAACSPVKAKYVVTATATTMLIVLAIRHLPGSVHWFSTSNSAVA